VPRLKNQLDVNLEPASPEDFMPVRSGALEQSPFVGRYGAISVFYYDLPSTVLAKVARGSETDLADIRRLVDAGMVDWEAVEAAWAEVRQRPTGWSRTRHTVEEIDRQMACVRALLGKQPRPPAE